ncbi:variable surface protein [Plasmodium gonderi]|uniref:Variable surface protein n=1 Tax=Plasmodium gonderi TaxID=77519 RepID=A0A1Y1JQQ6_PLAGO|nr:variable surface protein [Plasmodium gonderi]GAW84560.1 variable surface protein [Plasmodium gonderi]
MGDDINRHISVFPQCRGILKELKDQDKDKWKSECMKIENKLLNIQKPYFNNICKTAMSYLYYLHRFQNGGISVESCCLYLYFWLYNELKKIDNPCATKSMYSEIFNEYNEMQIYVCKVHADSSITDDTLEKIKQIYDLSICLNVIENSVGTDIETKHCSSLISTINEYNKKNITQASPVSTEQISVPSKSNIVETIVITILVTVVISLLLLIGYNSTPNISHFLHGLKRKIYINYSIDDRSNIMQQSEDFMTLSRNSIYNMYNNTD